VNDREARTERARIRRVIKQWHDRLGLGWWYVDYLYERDPAPSHDDGQTRITTRATATALWDQGSATITFFMTVIADLDDDQLEYTVVHEMCHIIVREMREDRLADETTHPNIAHEERVVTNLARAFITVRDQARP